MTVRISERQLARIESGRDQVARVRVGRKDYVLLSQSFYEQVRPLLDYMTRQPAKASDARATAEWSCLRRKHESEVRPDRTRQRVSACRRLSSGDLWSPIKTQTERTWPPKIFTFCFSSDGISTS